MRNSASTKIIALHIKRIYNNPVGTKLIWDETKRASNEEREVYYGWLEGE